ncbi:MAG: EamA family transporter [Candidatus Limnocylindria bacterium]
MAAKAGSADPLRLALGYGAALLAAALFAFGGIFAKGIFRSGIQPSELAELRILFGFLVFLAAVAVFRRRDLRVARRDLPLIVFFGIFALAGVQWTYYESIQRLPLGVALVIQYTGPLVMLAYARWRGIRVGGRLWLAGALTIAGSFLVVGAYDADLLSLNLAGIPWAVLAMLIFVMYFLLAERILARYSVWALLVYGFGAALVAWMLVRPLWLLPWNVVAEPVNGALLAGVIVMGTTLPFALIFLSVSLIPAARTGLTSTAEPVVAAAAAWLLLSETLQLPQVLGGAVVLAGIAVAQSLRPTAGSV